MNIRLFVLFVLFVRFFLYVLFVQMDHYGRLVRSSFRFGEEVKELKEKGGGKKKGVERGREEFRLRLSVIHMHCFFFFFFLLCLCLCMYSMYILWNP